MRSIKEYHHHNRFICYVDETWYDTHDVARQGWTDSSNKCALNVPPSKGKRIIILHAGSEDGWVGDVLLSGKNISKCNLDYHQDMTAQLFEEWFEKSLLPSLPANSVIVLDNASYHSRQLHKVPNASNTKAELMEFLYEQNLYFEEHYTKKQLLEVLRTEQFSKQYVIDHLAESQGHIVLRLPPYFCIFNPIELIWGQLKNNVRKNNRFPKFTEQTIDLIKDEIKNITPIDWKNSVGHVMKIEAEYMKIHKRHPPVIIQMESSDDSDDGDDENISE